MNSWSRKSRSTVCAVSTKIGDYLSRPWSLHPNVAVRSEQFGALAYHYDTRRLTFLKSPDLVEVLTSLADQPSPRAAFDACGLAPERWPSFERALDTLAQSDMIVTQPASRPDEHP